MTRLGDAKSVCIVPQDKYIRPALKGPKPHTAILQFAIYDSEGKWTNTLLNKPGTYGEGRTYKVPMRQRMVHV